MATKATRITIQNAANDHIVVLVLKPETFSRVAIIMHGLGSKKEEVEIHTMSEAFLDNGIATIRFDTRNSIGESDGDFSEATTTQYYEDLETVIMWAKQQDWFKTPFFLAGHSLGSLCITEYAQAHPEEICGLAPIATGISGEVNLETKKEWIPLWKEHGSLPMPHNPKLTLKYAFIEDYNSHDIRKEAASLTMPVIMAVGDKDETTPRWSQEEFFALLPGKKEFHIFKGAHHLLREKEHLEQLYTIMDEWIKTITS